MAYNLLDYLSWLRALELQQIELREAILTYEGYTQTLRRLVWLTQPVRLTLKTTKSVCG